MISLNLLPASTKRQINKDVRQIVLINNVIVLAIVLVIMAGLLMASQRYLGYKLEQINQVEITSDEEMNISGINKLMTEIEVVQGEYVKWSRIIQNFMELVPAGNRLNSLVFDKANKKLSIQGVAETRDVFLELESNLKKFDLVTDIKSPISNLLYQTDINFGIEATLNL